MKILALILARKGSKRLPGKNIRLLGGEPLIGWSIKIGKLIPDVCDILVSTDSEEIRNISINMGAYAPWLRPLEFSTDTASSIDAALHALDLYESEHGLVDGVLLLQPTSPFRRLEKVMEGIDIFVKNNFNSVIGVSPTHSYPEWMFRVENNVLIPYLGKGNLNTRSQDLDDAYIVNGSFYLTSPCNLRKEKSFFTEGMKPLIIDSDLKQFESS